MITKRKFLTALLLAPFIPVQKIFAKPESVWGKTVRTYGYEELGKRFTPRKGYRTLQEMTPKEWAEFKRLSALHLNQWTTCNNP